MAPPRGSAAYKKKDGTLALSRDSHSVSWTPAAPGSKPALTLPVTSITSESLSLISALPDVHVFFQTSNKHQRPVRR